MKRKQLITYILLGLGVLVLLALGGMLFYSIIQLNSSEQSFRRLRSRLTELYRSEVFPSEANMEIERQNRAHLEEWFRRLLTTLGEENISRDDRSPSQFIGRLERTRTALRQQAQQGRIRLPEDSANFAFGFERYAGTGMLPSPDDVPRLTEQLIIITRLSRLLLESEVQEIRSILREVFEDSASAATPVPGSPSTGRTPVTNRRGTAQPDRRASSPRTVPATSQKPGVMQTKDMFSTYRFVLEFHAREEALAHLLNALAASPMFTVVRSVRFSKNVPDMVAVRSAPTAGTGDSQTDSPADDIRFLFGAQAAPDATASPSAPGQSQLVLGPSHPVSGIEMETPLQVRLEVDVYKFRSADEAQN